MNIFGHPRHPPSTQLDNDLIDDWNVGTEILVNRIESDCLEATVTLNEVRSATQEDPALSLLCASIGLTHCPDDQACRPFKHIYHELTLVDGIVVRNDKIVVPESLQQRMIESAHEGH